MTKKKMLLLCIIIIFTMMGYGTVIPLNNYFVNYLDFSSLQVGLLISLYALGQLISAPIIGGFVDEIGNKKSILFSFVLYIIFFICTFTFNSKMLVLTFRLLSGICAGTITLSIENYIGNNVKEELKVKYFTYSSFSIGIGMVIGPILGIVLLYSKIVLLIIALLSVLVVIILMKLLKEDKKFHKNQNMITEFKNSFLLAIKSKLNIYILIIFMIFGIITSSLESKVVVFMFDNYKLNELNIPLLILGVLFVVIYALVIHQKIGAKLNKLSYVLSLVLLTSLSLMIIYLSNNNINLLVIGFVLLTIALSSLISTLTSLITTLKTKAGVLLGLRNTFLFIGMIIGPIITAYLYDINAHILFLILSLLTFIMFLYGEIKLNGYNINEIIKVNKNEK